MSRRAPTEHASPDPAAPIAPAAGSMAQAWGQLCAVHLNGVQRLALLHRCALDEMRRSQSLMEVLAIQATVQRALWTDWMEYAGDLARVFTAAPTAAVSAAGGRNGAAGSGSLEPVMTAMAEPMIQAWETAALQPLALPASSPWQVPPAAARVAAGGRAGDRPNARAEAAPAPGRPVAAARRRSTGAAGGKPKAAKGKAPRKRAT